MIPNRFQGAAARRPSRVARAAGLAALLAAHALACDGGGADGPSGGEAVEFDSGVVRIESDSAAFTLRAEIAERPEQRTQGLMERTALDEDAGMIFLFEREQPVGAGFYMFRTRIPLDIAFMDGEGRIVEILGMEPCPSPNPATCPRYSPGVPYVAALEVNRGYFERHGIGVGDRVSLERPDGARWPPTRTSSAAMDETGVAASGGNDDDR